MKLYYAPGTCALACWIALEWAGTDYEVEKVDPQSEAYKTVNPLGMVPALSAEGWGRPLTQADAILGYIAARFQDAALGPDPDLDAGAVFTETMAFLTGDFHPAFWPFFAPQRYTTDHGDAAIAAVKNAVPARVARVLAHLDALIGSSGHVYGGRRSVADAYAFIMTGWSDKIGLPWRSYPAVAGFMDRMAEDAAVKTVLSRSKTG